MNSENIFYEKSSSGIRIIGEKIPYVRSASVGVWVKAGEVYESENEKGISHFIEHMLFKGTKTRDAKQIALVMDEVGGSINAFTSKELTCFYTRTLDEDIGIAIDLLLDMVCNPRLSESDIENEKNVVCEEILMSQDDPGDVAQESLYEVIYEGYPLSKPILGTQESVKAITREDIINYMDRRYIPENIVVSCAGNLDKDQVLKLVNEKYKQHCKKAEQIEYSKSKYDKGTRLKIINKDVEQAHICIAFPGVKYDDEDSMTLAVIDNIFGGSSSSRLFQSIREERGLAYSVYSAREPYNETGYWELYAATAENRAFDVVDCMFKELKTLKDEGLTNEEFVRSKNQLRRGLLLTLESVSAHSNFLGRRLIQSGKIIDVDNLLNDLDAVTMEAVNKLLNRIIDHNFMCGVIVSSGRDKMTLDRIEKMFNAIRF